MSSQPTTRNPARRFQRLVQKTIHVNALNPGTYRSWVHWLFEAGYEQGLDSSDPTSLATGDMIGRNQAVLLNEAEQTVFQTCNSNATVTSRAFLWLSKAMADSAHARARHLATDGRATAFEAHRYGVFKTLKEVTRAVVDARLPNTKLFYTYLVVDSRDTSDDSWETEMVIAHMWTAIEVGTKHGRLFQELVKQRPQAQHRVMAAGELCVRYEFHPAQQRNFWHVEYNILSGTYAKTILDSFVQLGKDQRVVLADDVTLLANREHPHWKLTKRTPHDFEQRVLASRHLLRLLRDGHWDSLANCARHMQDFVRARLFHGLENTNRRTRPVRSGLDWTRDFEVQLLERSLFPPPTMESVRSIAELLTDQAKPVLYDSSEASSTAVNLHILKTIHPQFASPINDSLRRLTASHGYNFESCPRDVVPDNDFFALRGQSIVSEGTTWEIGDCIAHGAFGCVYRLVARDDRVLKVSWHLTSSYSSVSKMLALEGLPVPRGVNQKVHQEKSAFLFKRSVAYVPAPQDLELLVEVVPSGGVNIDRVRFKDADAVWEVAGQLLRELQRFHVHGWVFTDLKPDNRRRRNWLCVLCRRR